MCIQPRKRDAVGRRRELCDAAIRVLAEHGARGLTHAKVDSYAEVPDGTTSYYYRTREALLRGVGGRVVEIDLENLRSIGSGAGNPDSPFESLARLILLQSHGDGLALNRARLELLLSAERDEELAAESQRSTEQMIAMVGEAIANVSSRPGDRTLVQAQTRAVSTFISGVFTRMAAGDRSFDDAAALSALLEAIVTAVTAAHDDANGPK